MCAGRFIGSGAGEHIPAVIVNWREIGRLFRGELDGRVHGCLDSSGCVREMAGVSSGMAGVSPGDYLTHLNDHCVVGNSLASVTELIRTAGRPLKLRFERGVPASDPYLYRGDVPIVRVCEVEGEAVDEAVDEGVDDKSIDDKSIDKSIDDKSIDDKSMDKSIDKSIEDKSIDKLSLIHI